MPKSINNKFINCVKTTIFAVLPLLFSAHSFAAPTATVGLKWTAQVEPRNCTATEVSNQEMISEMKDSCDVALQVTSTKNDDVMSFNI